MFITDICFRRGTDDNESVDGEMVVIVGMSWIVNVSSAAKEDNEIEVNTLLWIYNCVR